MYSRAWAFRGSPQSGRDAGVVVLSFYVFKKGHPVTELPLWAALSLPLTGYAVALATEYIRGRGQSNREAAQRDQRRQETIADRRDQFELDVLKDTNSALQRHARAVMQLHLWDLAAAVETGQYASSPRGDRKRDKELRLATVDISGLAQLILDDDIRQSVIDTKAKLLAPSSMHGSKIEDAKAAMDDAMQTLDSAHKIIGARVRELYSRPSGPAGKNPID